MHFTIGEGDKMTAERANKIARTALRRKSDYRDDIVPDASRRTATSQFATWAWFFPKENMYLWTKSKKIGFANDLDTQFDIDKKTLRCIAKANRTGSHSSDIIPRVFGIVGVLMLAGVGIYAVRTNAFDIKKGAVKQPQQKALQEYDSIKSQQSTYCDTIMHLCR
ncbi:MAG: hypothetical protein J5611_02270 [Alphaproteobacteria bacterium]|nr:hypothetical protein [Alphaproteobacteria bacterium]